MCVFDGLGKLSVGKCVDFFHWNAHTINSIVLLIFAIAITLLPLANKASHIFLFAAFYGFAFGVKCLMVFIITPQLYNDSKQAVSYLFCALSIPGGIGPALAGKWSHTSEKDYESAV